MVHLVTHRGLIDLRAQIAEATKDLTDFDRNNPPLAARSRERVLEESIRAQQRLTIEQRLARLQAVVNCCHVVEPPTNIDRLQVGHIATVQRSASAGAPFSERRYLIGGHLENDPHANPPVISYDAPLVASLMGCEVGASEDVTVAGRLETVELIAIELPAADRPTLAIAS